MASLKTRLGALGARLGSGRGGRRTPEPVLSVVVPVYDVAAFLPACLDSLLGQTLAEPSHAGESEQPLAPGMLASHYAPRTSVRLNARRIEPGEALLAFGPALPSGADRAAALLNLSERGDLIEAAANLFDYLRKLDERNARMIAVMPIPDDGLGEAINDRLRRAAV